jgi:hypothetical protein
MFNHGFNCDRCGVDFFTTDYRARAAGWTCWLL